MGAGQEMATTMFGSCALHDGSTDAAALHSIQEKR